MWWDDYYITDNVLISFENNHYIKRCTQNMNGVAILKIDVSKSYDRLEWNFIESIQCIFGFHQTWIIRVLSCVRTITYNFLKNNMKFGEIQPQRGIRYGEPISLYLYILWAKGLRSIIWRNEEVGLIHKCTITREHELYHIFCLLMTIISSTSLILLLFTIQEATVMNNIIWQYEKVSCQVISFNESNITFSPNDMTLVYEILEVAKVFVPGKYLGIPMNVGPER